MLSSSLLLSLSDEEELEDETLLLPAWRGCRGGAVLLLLLLLCILPMLWCGCGGVRLVGGVEQWPANSAPPA